MENIESLQAQLSLAGKIAVSHKNNMLTDRIFLQISGRKQISAQQVINGTTVHLWVFFTLILDFVFFFLGISLKWKTNSGATWNLLALTVIFIAWAVTAVVETLSSKGKSKKLKVSQNKNDQMFLWMLQNYSLFISAYNQLSFHQPFFLEGN